jgi:hypothetical protein
LLVINQDCIVEPGALETLVAIAAADDDRVAAWEMRQIPYEHPKAYDPVTLDVPWVSGAATLFRRAAFDAVGGFDDAIFMYGEDVDLSWRLRARGWRRFGLYTWDQGPGLPGDWNGRLAPAFEFVFHFNRQARQANKIVPCKWAGTPNKDSGLRAADGSISEYQHAGLPVQDFRIPDNVLRLTRHKGRGIETEHPAVFPVVLPEFLMRAYTDVGELVFEPFAGSGTTLIAGERTGRIVRGIELAPAYVDLAIARWRMLCPDQPVTLEELSESYGVSRERIRQIEVRAFEKLQSRMRELARGKGMLIPA